MKFIRIIILAILMFEGIEIFAQNFLSLDMLTNVWHFKYKDKSGTSFVISDKEQNYVVTAKHLFGDIDNGDFIKFQVEQNSIWKEAYGYIFFDTIAKSDIVLIKSINIRNINSPFSLKPINILLGDEGFFIGFPYGRRSIPKDQEFQGFPIPLVKKAGFSGLTSINNSTIIYLDGHNNPGFSGGPVLFTDRVKGGDNKLHLIGVISAYVSQENEVNSSMGKLNYIENSGIIVSYGVSHILNILEQIETQ